VPSTYPAAGWLSGCFVCCGANCASQVLSGDLQARRRRPAGLRLRICRAAAVFIKYYKWNHEGL
jgi:hypothetical protein